MKKLFTLSIILSITIYVFAQAPQRLSYQAVIRNSSGDLITSHAIGMKISILQDSPSGTAVYVETHKPTTNDNGLATIEIGGGSIVSGTFTEIKWGSGTYYLKTEADPEGGTIYSVVGTSQLLSVPYALNSETSESVANNSITSAKIVDGTIIANDIANSSITSAKIADNSISTADLTDNSITTAKINNLSVTTDKIGPEAITLDKIANGAVTTDKLAAGSVTNAKIINGAVTGSKIAQMSATSGQVLKWNNTSWAPAADDDGPWTATSDYIYNAEEKNFGLGISNPTNKLTLAKNGSPCYMNIQNSSTGYTSYDGMFIGTSGLNSYVSSYEAGSLYLGTNADIRLAIVSNGNVGIGTLTPAYKLDVKGAANLNKGIASGPALNCNGAEAIWYDGTYFSWGYGGTFNVFHDPVGISCQPGDGHLLAVNGVASKPGGGTWAAFSDIRLKDIHGDYKRGLGDIIRLEPVRFNYKNGNPLDLPSKPEYVGFVAQDVQKVFPEAITETSQGFLEFDMHLVNVAVVNAVKELKAENDVLKARIEKLEKMISLIVEK
ncbi:MAG TPA: tail fiber domain-containing protein [Bacteroidales bacterium]|jgi:hypothetical protein|nr:MAG: hypothetical protein BWX96_02976 [Bacteroidetes bacterium ADurb.Bin145]HOU02859.1 tail fiber domain-containing protein [Bacteroidales bacterium]HQK68988.1 tail fiber domain-containing protein [Bacteroidales bacterium]